MMINVHQLVIFRLHQQMKKRRTTSQVTAKGVESPSFVVELNIFLVFYLHLSIQMTIEFNGKASSSKRFIGHHHHLRIFLNFAFKRENLNRPNIL